MKVRSLIAKIIILLYAILWIGGIVSYVFLPSPPEEIIWTAPAFLFIAAIYILYTSHNIKHLFLLLMIGVIGFAVEVIGINTGYPFGNYIYPIDQVPKLLDVPLVLIAAWLILIAYSWQFVLIFKLPRFVGVIISGLIMVLIDLLIDPIASGPLKIWIWKETGQYYGTPYVNFFGWFAVSILLLIFYSQVRQIIPQHRLMGLSIILFFTIIALFYQYTLPIFIGFFIIIAQSILEILFRFKDKYRYEKS